MSPTKELVVFSTVHQLYRAGQFQQAFDLLSGVEGKSPEQNWQKYFGLLGMAARLDKPDLAEDILRKALDAGYFFTERTLRNDGDLRALQGRAEFEKLIARDVELLAVAQQTAAPGLTLLEAVDVHITQVPLLMTLHGNNSNVERIQGYWNSLSDEGWLVALPQSSQLAGNGVFCWNDQPLAKKELLNHYTAITNKISVDESKTIITGFSMGGRTAINAALQQYFPIHGFLAVAPFIRDLAEMERSLASIPAQPLRGYFLLGQDDEGCTPNALSLHRLLNNHGIACEVELFPHTGHDFPDDYRAAIGRGLQFILQ
jgi:dienelactone hydrolase